MPIYEYTCKACGKNLEILVRSGKAPKLCGEYCESEEHPQAGKGQLKKLISKAGIIFKGTGFHVNDYSGGGGGESSSNGKDSASSSGSSDSKSSDSGSSKSESSASSTSSTSAD